MANKKQITTNSSDSNEVFKLIKLIIIVTAVFLLMYGLTVLLTKNKTTSSKPKATEESVIQYDEVIIGTMLKQNDREYYVLLKEENDDNSAFYDTYVNTYSAKDGALKVYTVDLSKSYNKPYMSEESNLNVDNIKDFKIKDTTLIKIKDGKIVSSYEGYNEITKKIKSMI